jgi:hypothetical protein
MPNPVKLTYHGVTASVRSWSDLLGLDYHTLLARIRRNWSAERAIEAPVLHKGRGRRTHGWTGRKEYRAWKGMIYRCTNPGGNRWHRYGGRGIAACERWRESFESFLQDLGPCPSDGHSLGRLDHDQGYSPENCRWQTPEEQAECWRKSRRRATWAN